MMTPSFQHVGSAARQTAKCVTPVTRLCRRDLREWCCARSSPDFIIEWKTSWDLARSFDYAENAVTI